MVKLCPICRRPHNKDVTCNDYQAVDSMFVDDRLRSSTYLGDKGYRIEPTKNLGVESARKSKKHWNEQAKQERAKLLEKYKK